MAGNRGGRQRNRAAPDSLDTIVRHQETVATASHNEEAEQERDDLVTVVIPTRNRAEVLATAVRSVQQQTWPHIEIIVVDDGSTDDTPAVLRRLSGSDRSVRIVRQSHRGHGASRNTGLKIARGEWVLFLDDDDLLEPGCIETLLEAAYADDVPAVACRATAFDAPLVPVDSSRLRAGDPGVPTWPLFGADLPHRVTIEELALRPLFPIEAILLKRGLMVEAGGFDERLPGAEDYDCWFRILELVGPFPLIAEPLVWVRFHPRQTSAAHFMMSEATYRVLSSVLVWHPELRGTTRFRRRMAILCRENAYAALCRRDGMGAKSWSSEGLGWSHVEWKLWMYRTLATMPHVFPYLVRWKQKLWRLRNAGGYGHRIR